MDSPHRKLARLIHQFAPLDCGLGELARGLVAAAPHDQHVREAARDLRKARRYLRLILDRLDAHVTQLVRRAEEDPAREARLLEMERLAAQGLPLFAEGKVTR